MNACQDTITLYNGVEIPCLGLGTYQSPDAVASAAVKSAMELGYRLIDTARIYGNEDGAPYWQVVAWNGENDPPLHVMLDARSGAILPDT